jgi:hypothetical protein
MTEHAFRMHARRLAVQELQRRRGALADLTAERRAVIERSVMQAVAASVDGVLEQSRDDPRIAAALDSVYGRGAVPTPASAGAD